ncbi:DUF4350 domain-containing protein [Mesorhizobium sp. IMUNJ 23232]|uniref:DUF4350 domain-containing protein n=1 Tax=Mesorhizobium sp. IMUNJ 23232 TaxID=3376064 RepID=UPI0037B8EAE4
MSLEATSPATGAPFNRRTVFWGVLASLLAAAGFVLLSTYAPDFRLGQQGGSSALSKSGAGFAGLVDLMTLMDDEPETARSVDDLYSDSLVIVTISPQSDPEALKEILDARSGSETLFVLPKWSTAPLPSHEGWEMQFGRLSAGSVDQWLVRFVETKIGTEKATVDRLAAANGRFAAPAPKDLQWAAAADDALISAGPGKGVLIKAKDEPFFVLTDPDLLDNAALKDPDRAAAAIGLIDMVRPNSDPVIFDLTLHGANRKHDLLKLLIEPPFLALTLSILAASALAVLHGLGRFGPAAPETRAIPFGKKALVETTATLMRRAGRLDGLGGRYAAQMRQRAGLLLGAPHGMQGDALDQWHAARDKDGGDGYAERAKAVRGATNEPDLTAAARGLHQWISRNLRERR